MRVTARKNGLPLIINEQNITYVEPAGDGSSANIYLTSREMLQVSESLDVVEARMNNFAALEILEVRPESLNPADQPQQRETKPAGKKDKKPEETAPETKGETEAGRS